MAGGNAQAMMASSEITGSLTTGVSTGVTGIVKAAPSASQPAGTYTNTVTLSLSAANASAICYSTSATTPSCANSTSCATGSLYSSALTFTTDTTLKALACYGDASSGPLLTNLYTITHPSSASLGGGAGGNSNNDVVPQTVTASNGPLVVNPSQIGSLRYSDRGYTVFLSVPAGSVNNSTTFSIKAVPLDENYRPAAGSRVMLIGGLVFEMSASDQNGPVTNFNLPLSISVNLIFPEITHKLGVYYFNTKENKWVGIDGASFDSSKGTVNFQTNHFTLFAIWDLPQGENLSMANTPAITKPSDSQNPATGSTDPKKPIVATVKGVKIVAGAWLQGTGKDKTVYAIIDAKHKRVVNLSELKASKSKKITKASETTLKQYATISLLANGSLMQGNGKDKTVYVVSGKTKKAVSAKDLKAKPYLGKKITKVNEATLQYYASPKSAAKKPAVAAAKISKLSKGQLVQGTGKDKTVYVVTGANKKPLTAKDLKSKTYQGKKIVKVSDATLKTYPTKK